jgi:hypothetical protein
MTLVMVPIPNVNTNKMPLAACLDAISAEEQIPKE